MAATKFLEMVLGSQLHLGKFQDSKWFFPEEASQKDDEVTIDNIRIRDYLDVNRNPKRKN